MKNFFSHDEGARNDPKLIKVLMRLGQAGKGVYWDLIEMLYEQDGYLLLSECESYAFALRTECALLESLINDFGLFTKDGDRFWSESALRRLEMRKAKSQKAAESAQKRWNNADAMRTHNDGNANKRKESKGKEKKEDNKEIDGAPEAAQQGQGGEDLTPKGAAAKSKFVAPTLDQVVAYMAKAGHPARTAEQFVDHFTSNGWRVGGKTPMKDWPAAVRNWMRNEEQRNGKPRPIDITSGINNPVANNETYQDLLKPEFRGNAYSVN